MYICRMDMTKKSLFILLLMISAIGHPMAQPIEKGTVTAKRNAIPGGYNFVVYTPGDYQPDGYPLPLVIFLHGASLCGNNLSKLKRYGVLDAIEGGKIIPTLVVSPQNPGGSWKPDKINDVLEWMKTNYRVDTTRVYVLGMSLGGYGTLDFAGTYPEKVAAAMALCGGTTLKNVEGLSKVPLWIMHGTADRAVPISQSKSVVEKLESMKGDKLLRYDWVKGASHGALARLFYLQKTYDWLFSHSLADNPRTVQRHFGIDKNDLRQSYRELRWMAEKYDKD